MAIISSAKNRPKYTNREKRAIVEQAYAVMNSLRSTAKQYRISPGTISKWKQKLTTVTDQLYDAKKEKRTFHPGPTPKNADSFTALYTYFEDLRAMHRPVTMASLIVEYKRLNMHDTASHRMVRDRLQRWLKRAKLCRRRVTHQAQNTRHLQEIMCDFVSYVNGFIVTNDIPPSCVVNIDETNVDFSVDCHYTLERVGARTVSVQQAATSNRCTALLGATLSGEKLKPFVIFKGQGRSRVLVRVRGPGYPKTLVFAVQEKAWMDERTMLQWIDLVWAPFCEGKPRTYLIMDEFSAHKTAAVMSRFAELGTYVDIIPGGYTSKLQAMDVGVNKPFKAHIRDQFERFMLECHIRQAPFKPTTLEISNWIDYAWSHITASTLSNTWRRIGICGSGELDVTSVEWETIEGSDDDVFLNEVDALLSMGVDLSAALESVWEVVPNVNA
jgi:hypothetical protein